MSTAFKLLNQIHSTKTKLVKIITTQTRKRSKKANTTQRKLKLSCSLTPTFANCRFYWIWFWSQSCKLLCIGSKQACMYTCVQSTTTRIGTKWRKKNPIYVNTINQKLQGDCEVEQKLISTEFSSIFLKENSVSSTLITIFFGIEFIRWLVDAHSYLWDCESPLDIWAEDNNRSERKKERTEKNLKEHTIKKE